MLRQIRYGKHFRPIVIGTAGVIAGGALYDVGVLAGWWHSGDGLDHTAPTVSSVVSSTGFTNTYGTGVYFVVDSVTGDQIPMAPGLEITYSNSVKSDT